MPIVPNATGHLSSLLASNLIRVEAQAFWMGSPELERDRKEWEVLHLVHLSRYDICKYQVTVRDFDLFVSDTSYVTSAETLGQSNTCDGEKWHLTPGISWRHGVNKLPRGPSDRDHPVVHVSWNDAVRFCDWASENTKRKCRLPTEAEWECACRAGTTSPFHTGNDLTTKQSNFHGRYPYYMNELRRDGSMGDRSGHYRQDTVAVNDFERNPWGLYNTHGNVYEWCQDWYRKEFYEECAAHGAVENPLDRASAQERVLRGGSWWAGAKYCRCASRYGHAPEYSDSDTGFRLVWDADGEHNA